MKISERPEIVVGINAALPDVRIVSGEYDVTHEADSIRYVPRTSGSLLEVSSVKIGLGFHWEREMPFLLRGTVIIRDNEDGCLLKNILPVEDYLESVVSSEMNPEAPVEFLRAHAIISRGWAVGKLSRHSFPSYGKVRERNKILTWEDTADHQGYDVCADDHCQRYQGVSCITEKARVAVRSTSGLVLTDAEGVIADTRFSKCCGGIAETYSVCWDEKDYPYLANVEDPYCNPAYMSRHGLENVLQFILKDYDKVTHDYFQWEGFVDSAVLRENLMQRYSLDTGEIADIRPMERGRSGRIKTLLIEGEKESIIIGKELEIRRALSSKALKSSNFEVEKCDGGFKLRGRGWGHGVGLCQIGGAVMASEGYTAEEILGHYYPHTILKRIY